MKSQDSDYFKRTLDIERRVAARRELRVMLDGSGMECLTPLVATMNEDQLDALRLLLRSYETLHAM